MRLGASYVAMEIELRRLVGYRVIVMGPSFLDDEKLRSVKLLAVEDAGIWIESQEAFDKIIGNSSKKPTSAGLALFIPFSQITSILAALDSSGIE
jgi:hypothetical protein